MKYLYREAKTEDDFERLRRLNHRTFAEELGQHQPAPDGRLIDRFEARSRYLLALDGDELAGMVSYSMTPPFSIESRLADAAILKTLPGPLCEVRLLAIRPEYRGRPVFAGLLAALLGAVRRAGAATLLISGVEQRVEMYGKMGFRPLGPAVPQGVAAFVPMALPLSRLPPRIEREARRVQRRLS